jgi:hypothetical protein
MSKITIEFNLDNDAFRTQSGRLSTGYIASKVREIADEIEDHEPTGGRVVRDDYGNRVGLWVIRTTGSDRS